MDTSPFILTIRNATAQGRCLLETLVLASSAFDFDVARGEGFGLTQLMDISGGTRREVLDVCEVLLTKGELDRLGHLYYGTKLALEAFEKIDAGVSQKLI